MNLHPSLKVKFNNDFKQVNNSEFVEGTALIAYIDKNRNYSDIPQSAFDDAMPSLGLIPVVGHWLPDKQNFGGHDITLEWAGNELVLKDNTVPYGCVKENNNAEYVDIEENGETHKYLKADVILWYGRYPEPIQKVIDTGVNQSMEINVLDYTEEDNGYLQINKFQYSALCLLGRDKDEKGNSGDDNVEPCFESASVVVDKFSIKNDKFKEQYTTLLTNMKQQFASSDNKDEYKITIDNLKKSADTSKEWKVNKGEYFKKIKGASNAKSVFKEAYADVSIPDKIEDITEADCKYPHHHIGDDNKMVISESGIKAARQRAGGQGLADDSGVMKHLRKHYDTLGIPWDDKQKNSVEGGEKDNMDKKEGENLKNKELNFSATYKQKRDALSNILGTVLNRDENGNVVSEIDYWLDDFDDKYCMVEKYTFTDHDRQDDYGRFTYSFDEENMTATITGEFEKLIKTALTQEEYDKVMADRADYSALKTKVADYEKKVTEFETKVNDLTKENEKLKENNQELSDYQQKRKTADHTDELNAEFTQFDEELKDNQEYITYKAQVEADVMAYTKEQVNEKLNAIFGAMQFSKVHKKKEDEKVTAPVIEDKSPEFTGSRYGKYERFIKK